MHIVLLEPFLTGSHAAWARELQQRSCQRIDILGLAGRHWKWRMHGGAVTLAHQFQAAAARPDLLLASDMLDLACFLALTRERSSGIPVALYFHENQLTYPWSPADRDPALQRDGHYAFINYTSALCADRVLFNSRYHRDAFLAELPRFLSRFPDSQDLANVEQIRRKSSYLPLGLDLSRFDAVRPQQAEKSTSVPLILWNHRWEYDKNPQDFFAVLYRLQEAGVAFELAVLGESFNKCPAVFSAARERLDQHIVHWGYADSFSTYARWLWRADILPVTSIHDFFGISVVEAIYCGCFPLLPRRLAYPEHLPHAYHDPCLYHDNTDLTDKLIRLCRQPQLAGQAELLSAHVGRYDWNSQIKEYDELFRQLGAGGIPVLS